jgi:SAM-dependent methyltransferase
VPYDEKIKEKYKCIIDREKIQMEGILHKLLIFAAVMILACCFTVFAFDTWQSVLLVVLVLVMVNYLGILFMDKLTTLDYYTIKEGFVNESQASQASQSKYEWLGNDDLFDDFYGSVFTKLTQNENLVQAEAAICMEEFARDRPKSQLKILDAGSGIGIATVAFVKLGAGHAVGIDKSQAMTRYAKEKTIPSTTLTDFQKQDVEFRTFDLQGPGAAAAAEFTSACLLYFSVYYFKDLDNLFRNLALWVQPGGTLAIEVVNKYKFVPILDSGNPWVGISPQNYSKERITKSSAAFDAFDYESVFELNDPQAEFRETFRFKDGSVRRQKHTLVMPNIPDIIKKAARNGWNYTKYVDLMPLSFQYGYLLFFTRQSN